MLVIIVEQRTIETRRRGVSAARIIERGDQIGKTCSRLTNGRSDIDVETRYLAALAAPGEPPIGELSRFAAQPADLAVGEHQGLHCQLRGPTSGYITPRGHTSCLVVDDREASVGQPIDAIGAS